MRSKFNFVVGIFFLVFAISFFNRDKWIFVFELIVSALFFITAFKSLSISGYYERKRILKREKSKREK